MANPDNNKRKGGIKAGGKGAAIDTFCAWDGQVPILNLLGTPSAKQDAIGKPKGQQLKISVIATPVAGKATDHIAEDDISDAETKTTAVYCANLPIEFMMSSS